MLLLLLLIIILYTTFIFSRITTPIHNRIENTKLNIDAYLYINLLERKDRKNEIKNEFKKIGFEKDKIFRIDAVHDKWNGHIGCVKSHIKALKFAKKHNFKNAIIFEDDFIFTKNKKYIYEAINNIDFKWDLIQLTSSYEKSYYYNKYFNRVNWAMSSPGYIINNKFYDKLIKNFNQSLYNMEREMETYDYSKGKKLTTNNALDQFWFKLQKNSNWYVFSPHIGKQSDSKSTIMKKNTNKQQIFNKVLNDMADILEKNNIKFMLYCGTALGAYREKQFIEWDHDIDLGVFKDDINMEKIHNIISNSDKFYVYMKYPTNTETINCTEITFKHKKLNVRIDICHIIKNKDNTYEHYTYTGVCDTKKNKRCVYKYPKFNINKISFFGRNYNIPCIKFIESQYGKNWKIADKYNYDPNKNSSLL